MAGPETRLRRIVGARLSDPLRRALGPVLDDGVEDVANATGIPLDLLANVLEGVPRPFTAGELAAIKRLAYLTAWDWNFALVELTIDATNIPVRHKFSTEPHDSV